MARVKPSGSRANVWTDSIPFASFIRSARFFFYAFAAMPRDRRWLETMVCSYHAVAIVERQAALCIAYYLWRARGAERVGRIIMVITER